MAETFLLPPTLKEILENHLKVPVVFKNQLKSWESLPWTNADLTKNYGNTLLDFRIVSKSFQGIPWEGTADYIQATISQFISWQEDENVSKEVTNPFCPFKKDKYWAYSSYNYMSVIFSEDSDILKAVDWRIFGFTETSGKESTFWLGSEGSCTPCHIDSYGCNLVAQIQGRKKWVLFPPEDSSFMYPTRIPYEESSVFSSVNILDPDLSSHPLFKESHPHVVIVEPGDVLFVPKKWWHFVLSMDVTLSINTWIKMDSDSDNLLEESVTRALMTGLISYYEPVGENWLNPKEEMESPDENFKYIISTLKTQKEKKIHKSDFIDKTLDCASFSKVAKTSEESDIHHSKFLVDQLFKCQDVQKVVPTVFSELFGIGYQTSPSRMCFSDMSSNQEICLKSIMNCFVHPDVITLICQKMKELTFNKCV